MARAKASEAPDKGVIAADAKRPASETVARAVVQGARACGLAASAKAGLGLLYRVVRVVSARGRPKAVPLGAADSCSSSPPASASGASSTPGAVPAPGFSGVAVSCWNSVGSDAIRFGLFVGLGVGTFHLITALSRRVNYCRELEHQHLLLLRGKANEEGGDGAVGDCAVTAVYEEAAVAKTAQRDWIYRSVAGAVAGGALLVDNPVRRQTIALYALVRALDSVRQARRKRRHDSTEEPSTPTAAAAVAGGGDDHDAKGGEAGGGGGGQGGDSLANSGWVVDACLFGLVNGPIMYGFLHNPSLLPRSYYKWICWMGQVSDANLDAMVRRRRRIIAHDGAAFDPGHVACAGRLYPHQVWDLVPDFFMGLGRAASVYAPVYLVPELLFRGGLLSLMLARGAGGAGGAEKHDGLRDQLRSGSSNDTSCTSSRRIVATTGITCGAQASTNGAKSTKHELGNSAQAHVPRDGAQSAEGPPQSSAPMGRLVRLLAKMGGSIVFLSSYQTIVKASQTLMHETLQWDAPWQAVVSGFATGAACFFEKPHRVNELMLYCLPHSFMALVALACQSAHAPVSGITTASESITGEVSE